MADKEETKLYDKLINGAKSACVKSETQTVFVHEQQTALLTSIAQSVLAIALMMKEERNAKPVCGKEAKWE